MAIERPSLIHSFHAPLLTPPDHRETSPITSSRTAEKKPKKRSRVPKWLRGTITCGAIALGSGTAAVTLTETSVPFGPHDADMSLNGSGRITFVAVDQNGESSSISRSIEYHGVGARIEVHDLPVKFEKDQVIPTKISDAELKAYASFFTNYEDDINAGLMELGKKFGLSALLGTLVFANLLTAEQMTRDLRRRGLQKTPRILKDLQDSLDIASRSLKGIRVGLAAMSVIVPSTQIAVDRLSEQPSPNLENEYDIPISEVSVEGRLRNFIQTDKEYYDVVQKKLEKYEKENPSPFPRKNTKRVLIIEGLKCNSGMVRIVGVAADIHKVSFIASGGDNELGNNPLFDEFCLKIYDRQTTGYDTIESAGYHTAHMSPDDAKKYRRIELNGKVIEKDGIRILGNADYFPTDGASNDHLHEDLGEETADTACADKKGVDVVIGNQQANINPTFARRCAELAVAGGLTEEYKVVTTTNGEQTMYFLIESSGGAVYSNETNFGTLGPLQREAKFAIATYDDTDDSHLLGLEIYTVSPKEGEVTSLHHVTELGETFLSELTAEKALQSAGA